MRRLCCHWLQVDISIKLQACTGSCQAASPLSVNHGSYQDSMDRLDKAFTNRLAAKAPCQRVPRLKLLTADLNLVPSAEYKTIPIVRRELLTEFEDIEQNQIIPQDFAESDLPCSEGSWRINKANLLFALYNILFKSTGLHFYCDWPIYHCHMLVLKWL